MTSIMKEPVGQRRVRLEKQGFVGDGQADLKNHGGVNKAVYCYANENYAYWREWGVDGIHSGLFGENLTTVGFQEDAVCIGDRIAINDALLCVTQPRIPCYKLAIRVNHKGFAKAFERAGRPGIYMKVLQTGSVSAEDSIEIVERHSQGITVRQAFDL